jgi:hypothetical protein
MLVGKLPGYKTSVDVKIIFAIFGSVLRQMRSVAETQRFWTSF